LANLRRARLQLAQGGELGLELIKALRDSGFVQQVIVRLVVEVVLILFDVG
jgi:hypothetical protein